MAKPRIRRDGSIQSSNTPTYQNLSQERLRDYALYRCMVLDYKYVDDSIHTLNFGLSYSP